MKVLIIGGGAAGFMAAITAALNDPDAQITLAEKSQNILAKVKVSGGGRCNVTHRPSDIDTFSKQYPRGQRFIKKILHEFGPEDTIQWFESKGVGLKVEDDGRMFPVTNNSSTIINCLVTEAEKAGIDVITRMGVNGFKVTESNNGNTFEVSFSIGTIEHYDKILIATGGFPKAEGFEWITKHGINIMPPAPSLFTFNSPENTICSLQGVSVPLARVKILGTKLEWKGPLLITHWGFSGPVILKLSAWGARVLLEKAYMYDISINWVADMDINTVKTELYKLRDTKNKSMIISGTRFGIPSRLWRFLMEMTGVKEGQFWADQSNKVLDNIWNILTNQIHAISGKTTFKEEFVTCGGVDLSEIDHRTMESKKINGLYFAGEVIDVDGITGGFNFQNAWTTGYIAGKSMASNEK